jgi:hypothetical protein
MTDRTKLLSLIASLAATFNREGDYPMYRGYEMGLADLALADVKRAAVRAIRECRFMPSVAELRELAGVIPPTDRAIKAWDAFAKGIAEHGYYASVDFDDPLINATARSLGGWEHSCIVASKGGDEFEKWFRKDFERVYAAFVRSGVSDEAAAPLIGYVDRTNAFDGYHDAIQPPAQITTDLPPHRDGVVKLPAQKPETQKLLTAAAEVVGRKP